VSKIETSMSAAPIPQSAAQTHEHVNGVRNSDPAMIVFWWQCIQQN